MHNATIAEWIIARFTDRNRASSIVGDLLELKPQKGLLWFWASIARLVVSLGWRRSLALIAAFFVGLYASNEFSDALSRVHPVHYGEYRFPALPFMSDFPLSFFSAFLWMILVYALIRYGLRDRVTQLALALAVLTTILIYCPWQPAILVLCVALGLSILAVSVVIRGHRKAAIALCIAWVTAVGAYKLTRVLGMEYKGFICHGCSGPIGSKEMHEHPSIVWMQVGLILLSGWMIPTSCSLMHRWLLSDKQLDTTASQSPSSSKA